MAILDISSENSGDRIASNCIKDISNRKIRIVKLEKLIEKFEGKQPEIVFAWKDSETEAEGWVVINSLRGGAAGGAG